MTSRLAILFPQVIGSWALALALALALAACDVAARGAGG